MPVDFLATFQARYPTGTTQIYVDQTSGSDTNPGTSASPKATIQGGLNAVGSTGKVWVRNGTYVMTDGFIPTKNGSSSGWIQVCAVAGQTPRISSPGNYQSLGIQNSSFLAFYGFEISGVSNSTQGDSTCVISLNSHHIAFWKNNIHSATWGINIEGGHHYDICYNKIGPNLGRFRTFGEGVGLKQMVQGGNDSDGFSTRIIGNVIHDVFEDAAFQTAQGGMGIYFVDNSGRGGFGGSAGTDKFLVGFNLIVHNGHAAINAFESDHISLYFNTIAHNVRHAGTAAASVNIGEMDIFNGASSIEKWNSITTRTGRVPSAWSSNSGTTPAPSDNVIGRGDTPALTGQRDRTATGDGLYKSPNDAVTNIDGWRAASTLETVQLNTASGGTTARDALQAWPDYFGELRPTADGNRWTLGWMEPTPVTSAPVANFTASPNPANINQTITFTDTSTGTPTSWLWNFGDGTTSAVQNPTKAYSAAGTYNVSLTATNAGGSNAKTIQVVVSAPQNTSPFEAENALLGGGAEPPQVLSTNTGYSGSGYVGFFGRIGNFVEFSISGLAAGTYALQLRWGKGDTGTAARLIRVNGVAVTTLTISQTASNWSDPARFVLSTSVNVTLTGGTNIIRVEYSGATDFQYADLDRILLTPVTAPTSPPAANFNISPSNPTPGALVSFTDTSTNSPTSWSWNFGDGSTSTQQNPTHAFVNAGTYNVSLTATNSAGSNTRTYTLVVSGVTTPPSAGGLSIQVTGNPLQNLTNYTAHVEVRDSNGLIGSDIETFSTSWSPPTAPTFTRDITAYDLNGYVTITWSNTVMDADFVAWRVYRRTLGGDPFAPSDPSPWLLIYETQDVQADYEIHDWEAPSGELTQWAVVQVAQRFSSNVESPYPASPTVVPVSTDYWLLHPDDETKNLRLHVVGDRFLPEREQTIIQLIGRGRRVEWGTNYGVSGVLQAKIRRDNTLTPTQQRKRLEALQSELIAYKLRTPFGHVWQVALANIPMTRTPGVGTEELMDIEITYNEVK